MNCELDVSLVLEDLKSPKADFGKLVIGYCAQLDACGAVYSEVVDAGPTSSVEANLTRLAGIDPDAIYYTRSQDSLRVPDEAKS